MFDYWKRFDFLEQLDFLKQLDNLKQVVSALLLGSVMVSNAYAEEEGHNHSEMKEGVEHSSHETDEMFMQKRQVDGYDVSFHIMPSTASMEHDGDHNLMIKIEKKGKVVEGTKINSKVIYPDGKAESKMLMKMGDWYMAGYNLKPKGRHEVMVLFKTADGSMHKGGVYYPTK